MGSKREALTVIVCLCTAPASKSGDADLEEQIGGWPKRDLALEKGRRRPVGAIRPGTTFTVVIDSSDVREPPVSRARPDGGHGAITERSLERQLSPRRVDQTGVLVESDDGACGEERVPIHWCVQQVLQSLAGRRLQAIATAEEAAREKQVSARVADIQAERIRGFSGGERLESELTVYLR